MSQQGQAVSPPRQLDNYVQYQHNLGMKSGTLDPTIPYYNDFDLLGLMEIETDAEIAQKAKQQADTRLQKVDQLGNAQRGGKQIDVLLRNTINQAGIRFHRDEQAVAAHRKELHRRRTDRLKEIAKTLGDEGKWSETEAEAILAPIALSIGIHQPHEVRASVSEAIRIVSWKASGVSPSLHTAIGNFLFDKAPFGQVGIPIWVVLPTIGLVLGVISGWAGMAYGILFLLSSVSVWMWERRVGLPRPSRNLVWGTTSAAFGSLPILALTLTSLGAFTVGRDFVESRPVAVGSSLDHAPLRDSYINPVVLRASRNEQLPDQLKATDGQISTAMVMSGPGSPWIELDLGAPVRVTGVAIFSAPGTEGARLRSARLSFDGKAGDRIELSDVDWWQIFPLETRDATRVRLAVESVYERSGESRASINEVWLLTETGYKPDARWAGRWDWTWGEVLLKTYGNWVLGDYQTGHAGKGGRLFLKPTGLNQVDGLWLSSPSFMPPNDAGRIRLSLTRGDAQFSGMYEQGLQRDLDQPFGPFERSSYQIEGTRIRSH